MRCHYAQTEPRSDFPEDDTKDLTQDESNDVSLKSSVGWFGGAKTSSRQGPIISHLPPNQASAEIHEIVQEITEELTRTVSVIKREDGLEETSQDDLRKQDGRSQRTTGLGQGATTCMEEEMCAEIDDF